MEKGGGGKGVRRKKGCKREDKKRRAVIKAPRSDLALRCSIQFLAGRLS